MKKFSPRTLIKAVVGRSGKANPIASFHSMPYLRHNARRLEHLASLNIPVAGASVLEVGAGIGDHTDYFLDRGCDMTITEARQENLVHLRAKYPGKDIRCLDMENPVLDDTSEFDVVYCYGLLYHLRNPEQALKFMSAKCKGLLLLETCVSFGLSDEINPVPESKGVPTQAQSGTGCRPTRPWLYSRLEDLFEHVYVPKTQPNHEQFPLDWTAPEKHTAELCRAVFVASRKELTNDQLSPTLIESHSRHA